jgi:hypothetical protein
MDGILNNVFFLAFAAWPGVVIGCALINMLCQWSFSWSELILDYVAGVVIGVLFYAGTDPKAEFAGHFFLVFSQGLFGLLHAMGVEALKERDVLFAVSAGALGGSVLLSGLLDLASLSIDTKPHWGNGLLSILIAPMKLPFSLFTTGVGSLIFLAGLVWYLIRKAQEDQKDPTTLDRVGIGHIGGVPYIEWSPKSGDARATTLGATFMVWSGKAKDVVKHELYHTRQYGYLHDWLIPFWLLGGLWGMISAAIANATKSAASVPDIGVLCSFSAARHDKEVGNPLERAAYARDGNSPC